MSNDLSRFTDDPRFWEDHINQHLGNFRRSFDFDINGKSIRINDKRMPSLRAPSWLDIEGSDPSKSYMTVRQTVPLENGRLPALYFHGGFEPGMTAQRDPRITLAALVPDSSDFHNKFASTLTSDSAYDDFQKQFRAVVDPNESHLADQRVGETLNKYMEVPASPETVALNRRHIAHDMEMHRDLGKDELRFSLNVYRNHPNNSSRSGAFDLGTGRLRFLED